MQIKEILKRYFGYTEFRPNQQEVITDVMAGHDVLVLMPTGGGKSLCYQIPALAMPGTAVVVSPLISLMFDQVRTLQSMGIPAAALNSNNDFNENVMIRRKCMAGELKLLYVSPEKLLEELHTFFAGIKISLFAIDEAHCISQWGHDFRPEYTKLIAIRQAFPQTPIIALTATADKVTREDIVTQLQLKGKTYISSFDRPNLSLNVRYETTKRDKLRYIVNYIRRHPDSPGIIYCLSRKTTENVASELRLQGIKAEFYHAGMDAKQRNDVQERFKYDETLVVCATIAFGMGIDKSNIRWIFHYNLPKSIESFYQEIGRAGRDGAPADTTLFFSLADVIQLRNFAQDSGQPEINMQRLSRMVEYAQSSICRRRILLNYFGEERDYDCGNCDVCSNPPEHFDGTILVQKVLSALARTQQQIRLNTLIEILRGIRSANVIRKKYADIKTFGAGKDLSATTWRHYITQMLHLGFIEIAYNENSHLKITPLGNEVLFGKRQAELVKMNDKQTEPQKQPSKSRIPEATLSKIEDEQLFKQLRQLRMTLARQQNVPPYVVFSDKVLHALAAERPTTLDAFSNISGIGEFKTKHYGTVFTEFIRSYLHELR